MTADALAGLADGGAYPAVRPSVVAETPCCRAPESILEAFSAAASSLVDRIEAARKQSSKLVSLRDTLLPKVISGELRIKDSESAMEVA